MDKWGLQFESITRDQLEQLQLERLQATVNRAYRSVVSYREAFDKKGIIPEDIDSLLKLSQLPFTNRKTLIENYPYGMFAVPLREVVRLHCSPGPEGKPIVIGYTKNDIDHWTQISARTLQAAGVNKDDVVQICLDYGLFGGGLGFHYGAELIEASVIPGSDLDPTRQLLIMRDYRSTILLSTPSFVLKLIAAMKENKISLVGLQLRCGLFTGESFSEVMRSKIREEFKIEAITCYSPPEISGPKIATECKKTCGLHIFEDQFIPEIIDPQTGKILLPGEKGELVLTAIAKEAFPLIRYRTGDITSLDFSSCECGRTFVRMRSVTGRTDDMVTVNGISFSPSQIGSILAQIEGAEPHFRLIIDREETQDIVDIMVEVSENIFFDEMRKFHQLKKQIEERIYQVLGMQVRVKLIERSSLSGEKIKKIVIDKRSE